VVTECDEGMGWLGLDDTDHLGGGCTTWTMHQVLASLPEGAFVVDVPRLVRLYPAAPHRTRGNAALAAEVRVECSPTEWLTWLDFTWKKIVVPHRNKRTTSTHNLREQSASDPGMVWFDAAPPHAFYLRAVRELVDMKDVPKATWSAGGRGRIGATAAVAWNGTRATWEGIAWRQEAKGARRVDGNVLASLDDHPDLFACRDPRQGRGLVAPRGVSPVLFGLRGTSPEAVSTGVETLLNATTTESAIAWQLHRTNQTSGDHLTSVMEATVTDVQVRRGGHVMLLTDHAPMVAFRPSGPVAALAATLVKDDVIHSLGMVIDGTVHLEGLRHVTGPLRDRQRPCCPTCARRMKSLGQGQGLRCRTCNHREPSRWIGTEVAPTGWVQPPLDRRRHLAPDLRNGVPPHLTEPR